VVNEVRHDQELNQLHCYHPIANKGFDGMIGIGQLTEGRSPEDKGNEFGGSLGCQEMRGERLGLTLFMNMKSCGSTVTDSRYSANAQAMSEGRKLFKFGCNIRETAAAGRMIQMCMKLSVFGSYVPAYRNLQAYTMEPAKQKARASQSWYNQSPDLSKGRYPSNGTMAISLPTKTSM